MKLNYKRVIYVGFAFFLISAFWQAYDTIIPKILTDKFGLSHKISGAIMALDNIFALVLLPVFGAISDKVSSRHGKRTPFIVIGTVIAAVLLISLSIPDNTQLKNLESVAATDGEAYTQALETIWDENPNVSDWRSDKITNDTYPLQDLISREEFSSIPFTVKDTNGKDITNPAYNTIVVPARQAYAARMTAKNAAPLIFFCAKAFASAS